MSDSFLMTVVMAAIAVACIAEVTARIVHIWWTP